MIIDYSLHSEQYSIMRHAIGRSQYVVRQLAKHLFSLNDEDSKMWIDEIAYNTGIDAAHLRSIFFSGEPMTLQDYIILSDIAEIDPLNDPDGNIYT